MKIWCLFGVDNDYNQPPDNLVAWWRSKPIFEVLLGAMGGSIDNEAAIIAAANVLQGQEQRFQDTDYRLEQVAEGRRA